MAMDPLWPNRANDIRRYRDANSDDQMMVDFCNRFLCETKPESTRQHLPWTREQVEALRRMWSDQTITVADIGRACGSRTGAAVTSKAGIVGLPPRTVGAKERQPQGR